MEARVTSIQKTIANRKNAQHSSGPRTPANKKISARNSLKHGLFSRELIVSEAETPEFEALRRRLYAQLLPNTALQHIGFEEVVCCCWRCRLAVRSEMQHLRRFVENPLDAQAQTSSPDSHPARAKWYASGPQALNDAVRFLKQLRDDFQEHGRIQDSWKEELDRRFGASFYELLTKWTPMSYQTIMMAEMLVGKSELLGQKSPFPGGKSLPKSCSIRGRSFKW
jgi:hypothetical protein